MKDGNYGNIILLDNDVKSRACDWLRLVVSLCCPADTDFGACRKCKEHRLVWDDSLFGGNLSEAKKSKIVKVDVDVHWESVLPRMLDNDQDWLRSLAHE